MLSDTTHLTIEPVMRAADWERGMTYAEFLPTAEDNVSLWHGVYERFVASPEAVARIAAIPGNWRLLVLSEDWCGDASNTVPVLARLAEATPNLDLRLLARDENLDLMDAHLTNGGRSIPAVILLDGDGVERGWWGPRPADIQRWVLTEGKQMEKDDRYREVRKWYARDRGKATIAEVTALLEAVTGHSFVG